MGALVVTLGASSPGWAARTCALGAVDVLKLSGQSPKQIRELLTPILGAPRRETNRLPDGGTFAKLDLADQQDGVSQTFDWGPDGGVIEIVYQRGRAQLVSARLDDAELSPQCKPWPRETLAAQLGLKRLGKTTASKKTGPKWAWLRFEPKLTEYSTLLIRMYCTPNGNECSAATIYLPNDVQLESSPADKSLATSRVEKVSPQPSPTTRGPDQVRRPLN